MSAVPLWVNPFDYTSRLYFDPVIDSLLFFLFRFHRNFPINLREKYKTFYLREKCTTNVESQDLRKTWVLPWRHFLPTWELRHLNHLHTANAPKKKKYYFAPRNYYHAPPSHTCASRYVDKTKGFLSPVGGPTNLPRPVPFLTVN